MMRMVWLSALIVCAAVHPGCIWRLWTKEKPIELRTFDLYGTVQSVSADQLVIETKKGERRTFVLDSASIKGSNFDAGAYVHVYYKKREGADVVTMVVEKIK